MISWLFRRWRTVKLYHKYYRRTGLYNFLFRNTFKLVTIILLILFVFFIIERYIIDFDNLFNEFIENLSWQIVILAFFISETLFGLIPPDLFIIWAEHFPKNYLIITYLAVLSYSGGFLSYKIGRIIRKIPSINRFVDNKFKDYFFTIKKWGAIVIIIGALFPLPFSTVSMAAGIMHYPLKYFVLFSLTRIPRFYIYALFFFQIMK